LFYRTYIPDQIAGLLFVSSLFKYRQYKYRNLNLMGDELMKQPTAIFALISVLLTACSDTESDNVKTTGVHAEIEVVANGSGNTDINVQLEVGSGGEFTTQLDLSNGDTLVAYANGEEQTLTKVEKLLGTHYVTTFNFDSTNIEFRVALLRNNDESAPNSTVLLPDPFAITSPNSGEIFARNADIVTTWDPGFSNHSIRVNYELYCSDGNYISTYQIERVISDSGQHTINATDLLGSHASQTSTQNGCDLNIIVSRTRYGNLDPNYGEGGYIKASQKRSRTVRIAAVM
jgi:hypothetical protein